RERERERADSSLLSFLRQKKAFSLVATATVATMLFCFHIFPVSLFSVSHPLYSYLSLIFSLSLFLWFSPPPDSVLLLLYLYLPLSLSLSLSLSPLLLFACSYL